MKLWRYGRAINVRIQNQQSNQDNSLTLLVEATGTWTYQLSAARRQQLARLIAGKSADTATRLLKQQAGIHNVAASALSGVLPGDSGRINIEVQGEAG